MSAPLELAPSIDLAAELASITQRQHLNDVHYAVQLVRHALTLSPLHLALRSRREWFELDHDGKPLDEDEHRLLLAVTNPDAADRQEALAELERRFGVALLSVLSNAERVELEGRRSLVAEGGWVRPGAATDRRGYRLRVWRAAKPRDERAELRFYCRHATVPVTLDGRAINKRLSLDGALMLRGIDIPDGTGLAAVPQHGAIARVRYFKHGVYFGVRRSLPEDGRPLEAVFDSRTPGFEENFFRSVAIANEATAHAKNVLYRELAAQFREMPPQGRQRARELLLGLDRKQLGPELLDMPVFHTSENQWRLSLRDLDTLARRRGYLPYLRRAHGVDDDLPVLSADDVAAVARLLARPVRHALSFSPRLAIGRRWRAFVRELKNELRPPKPRAVVPPDRIEPELRELIAALEEADRELSVRVTDGGVVHVVKAGARRTLYVPRDDPELARAIATWRERPDAIDVVASALLLGA